MMSTFSDRIKLLRLERGEKQSDVAELLGVSVQSYSAYESSREPNYDLLCKLAEHFGTTTDFLLGKENAVKRENSDIMEKTGLSEKAVETLYNIKRLNDNGKENMLKLLDMILTDFRFYPLANTVKEFSDMKTIERAKEMAGIEININEITEGGLEKGEKYKQCDKMVESVYGKGNAAIIYGGDLKVFRENLIKDTFFNIIDKHE